MFSLSSSLLFIFYYLCFFFFFFIFFPFYFISSSSSSFFLFLGGEGQGVSRSWTIYDGSGSISTTRLRPQVALRQTRGSPSAASSHGVVNCATCRPRRRRERSLGPARKSTRYMLLPRQPSTVCGASGAPVLGGPTPPTISFQTRPTGLPRRAPAGRNHS